MEDLFNQFNLEEINEVLENLKHRDPYRKEVGDRVNILDFSSCCHMNGRDLDNDNDEEMQFNKITHFIVIETGQNYVYDAYYKKFKQNLVIVNPLTDVKYRINSGHVQLK